MLIQALGQHVVAGDADHRQINRLIGLMRASNAIGQAFQGIERRDNEAAVFQLMLQGLTRQFMVFQNCHPASEQRRRGQVFGIVTGLGQAQADPELRAFARCAVDADFTAHLFDQAFGNHQPQTGATRLARQRVVRLTECLEQGTHVLSGQANASVLNADTQLHTVFVFFFQHRSSDDGAFAGELDGVADQIGEDLFQTQRVTDQFQLLGVRGGGEDGQGVLQQIAQIERNVVEHQFAGLDFREVEDLVDDPQQAVGGFFDGAQIVELARGQFAFLQQMGEAENAVERRADLVAHVGEKFGFDPAGLQRLFARQIQFDVLDFDGFQVLPDVFGGLIDTVLQFFASVLQGTGHAVDAGGQFIQFLTAERRQTRFQMTVLELRDGLFDLAQRTVDGAAHAQGQQRRARQTGGNQQQTGKQTAITAQQHAVVR
ncbi:hypothetical protein PS681_06148 [Pseudomonas fluorescens]|nr:hypothetical protein PS681_06148 [Pseudomonas fluorescens]